MIDAIIILGSGINQDGSLPDNLKLRVSKGVQLYTQGLAKNIVMSGNYSFWLDDSREIPFRSEASAMREYALMLGVLETDIFIEEKSKDTLGNAFFTKIDYLEKNDWKQVMVVTSDFHLKRTKFVFDHVLGPQYAIEYYPVLLDLSADEKREKEARETNTTNILRALMRDIPSGDTEAIRKAMHQKHPGYAANPEISFDQLREMLD